MADQISASSSDEDFYEEGAPSLREFFAIHADLVRGDKVEMWTAEMCVERDAQNMQTLRSAETFALSKIVGRSNSR